MEEGISYTFPSDCKIAALRGETLTGGAFARIDGKTSGTPDAVLFWTTLDGQRVPVKVIVSGKPELEALLAAHLGQGATTKAHLEAIGWPQYEVALRAMYNAEAAYNRASERGYPAREATALEAAQAALAKAEAQYPGAAGYGEAQAYAQAANYAKAAAGKAAMAAIEAGEDPAQAIAKMKAAFQAAARAAVD